MTLNDVKVIHLLQAVSDAIRRTAVQPLTRYEHQTQHVARSPCDS